MKTPVTIGNQTLRHQTLERYANGLTAAISTARNSLLAANLIGLLLVGSLFNSYFSWNYSQQERRAQLMWLASEAETVSSALANKTSAESESAPKPDYLSAITDAMKKAKSAPDVGWFEYIRAPEYSRELSYLKILNSTSDLKFAASQELAAHIAREKEQDTLHLPFISTSFAATDRTIIGGLALMLVAAWLIGALGRQQTVLDEFISYDNSKHIYVANGDYDRDEHSFVFRALCVAAAFTGSKRSADVFSSAVGGALWLIPALSIALCATYYGFVSVNIKIGGGGRLALELCVTFLVVTVWWFAFNRDRITVHALRNWEARIADMKAPPAAPSTPSTPLPT